MSVTVAQIRERIADLPRWNGPRNAQPELLTENSDGATLGPYYLRFVKAFVDSVELYVGTYPTVPAAISWAAVPRDDATNPWGVFADADGFPYVQFAQAAPPKGKLVGARYKLVAFTDAEIQGQIDDAASAGDDVRQKKLVHYNMIPEILSNRDAFLVTQTGPFKTDPSKWAQALLALRKSLEDELQLGGAVGSGAAIAFGGYPTGYLGP